MPGNDATEVVVVRLRISVTIVSNNMLRLCE
jgi:hypothetical protein